MEHKYPFLQAALLCESVTTDEVGRHSIHNEFSQYTMGYSQPFTILTIWRGGSNESSDTFKEKIELTAPDGRVVAAGENGPFSLQNNTFRQVNSLLFDNVDFTYEGTYDLSIYLFNSLENKVCEYTYPITVV